MRILINGMYGLGDNLYQLAFIHGLAEQGHDVTITTTWPEIYTDIPGVKFQRPHTTLRTQAKNAKRIPESMWSTETRFDKRLTIHYDGGSVVPTNMQEKFGGVEPIWGLRSFEAPASVVPKQPYVIVRPVTARKEWLNTARNPLPEYIAQVTEWLSKDYNIISVADLEDGQEWLVGEPPFADSRYHQGELTMPELFGLCQGAAAIVGGIGWVVPFAINTGVPSFIVCGGNGGYNHPAKLVNDTMDLKRLRFAVPDNLCMCTNNTHDCDRTITDLRGKFDVWKSLL